MIFQKLKQRILGKKEFDYTQRERYRLKKGLPPLGKKNAITKLTHATDHSDLNIYPDTDSHIQEKHLIGDIRLKSYSPERPYYVLFHDDGEVAYFFAFANIEEPYVMDALQIYNTADIVDRDESHLFEIVWSEDALKAALLINKQFHAVFDFVEYRGCCRTNFPPSNPDSSFGEYSHEWSDECVKEFMSRKTN